MHRRGLVSVAAFALVVVGMLAWRAWPRDTSPGVPVHFGEGETFYPQDFPADIPHISADQAWAKWEGGQHLRTETTAQSGVFQDQHGRTWVWAFSQPGCQMPLGGRPSPSLLARLDSPKCRLWTFLNPRNGVHILSIDYVPKTP
jgi:hypothetical protein